MRAGIGAVLVGLMITATATVARAQCSTDQECKADRICEAGQCTAPPTAAAPAPAPAAATIDKPGPRERFFEEAEADEKPRKVKKRIGNPPLMIGGIVLASAAPIVLVTGVLTSSCSSDDGSSTRCDLGNRTFTFGLIAIAMIGAAVPMIVIGAKRVPVGQVAVGPLLAPGLSGLQLQLRLY